MTAVDPIVAALKAERRRRRWTQGRVARAAGISASTVCYCERGLRAPSLPVLQAWAVVLGRQVGLRCPDPRPHLVIDPGIARGEPSIGGISIGQIADLVWSGMSWEEISADYDLGLPRILLACAVAGRDGTGRGPADTARWRQRWGAWSPGVLAAMWDHDRCDYGAIPWPPSEATP